MAKIGRPTKFDPLKCEQATKLARLGATDKEVADFFEVTESTFYLWKEKHPEFSEALKAGKEISDSEVAQSLFHRAKGYSHAEDKIFLHEGQPVVVSTTKHYPPDSTACIFWLKNRRRETWRDKQDHEHTGKDGGPIETKEVSTVELARRAAFLLASVSQEKT